MSSSGTVWTVDTGAIGTSKLGGDITTAGKNLLDDADAAAQRTTLGLGTAATSATSAFEAAGAITTHAAVTSGVHGISAFGATLVDDADASAARTTLGLGTAATTASTAYATASHTHAASDIASGTVETARLGTGTADGSTFLRGDQTYASNFSLIVKPSSNNIASNTTLADVSGLTFAIPSTGTWLVRCVVYLTTPNGNMDYKYGMAFTGTATYPVTYRKHRNAGATAGAANENTLTGAVIIPSTSVAATTFGTARVETEMLIVCTVTGTVSFQIAQATTDAANLTVLQGSYMEYIKVA